MCTTCMYVNAILCAYRAWFRRKGAWSPVSRSVPFIPLSLWAETGGFVGRGLGGWYCVGITWWYFIACGLIGMIWYFDVMVLSMLYPLV